MQGSRGVLIFAISVVLLSSSAKAQIFPSFPHGLGIEVGTGYNQLLWHVNDGIGLTSPDYPREEFNLTPTVRIRYEFYPVSTVQVLPFIGYDAFGGLSKTSSDGYKDEYRIRALEIGLFASYAIDDLRIGAGFKYNRHFNVRHHNFGTLGGAESRSWSDNEDALFIRRYSFNIAPRVSWALSSWCLSAEAWFGLGHIEQEEMTRFLSIRENHYRILVGYVL